MKQYDFLKFQLIFLGLSFSPTLWAADVSVSSFEVATSRSETLSNVVIDSQVTTGRGPYARITLHLSCYATNLRSIGNPVAENSLITAVFDVYDKDKNLKNFQIQFPAEYLKHPTARKPAPDSTYTNLVKIIDTTSTPKPSKLKAYDNVIQFLIQDLYQVGATPAGEVENLSANNLIVSGVRFIQEGAPGLGDYFGSNGPLSSSMTWYTSKDGRNVQIYASFPGAAAPGQSAVYLGETRTGFCGGYYSPLMLTFDGKLPEFTNKSNFPLSKDYPSTYWPEANAPGYFLVHDKNKNKKIDDGTEVFGNDETHINGFKKLADYDLNKDRVIDSKDAIFKDLKLWNDKNGDGITKAKELFSLKEKNVEKIILNYVPETKMFGDRAEYREKSTFIFTKGRKKITGQIYDIWLSPAGSTSAITQLKK